jgi:hypothetical protein
MIIEKPGKYRLTERWSCRGSREIQHFSPGTVIEIKQVHEHQMIGPQLCDWAYYEMPAELVTEK